MFYFNVPALLLLFIFFFHFCDGTFLITPVIFSSTPPEKKIKNNVTKQ